MDKKINEIKKMASNEVKALGKLAKADKARDKIVEKAKKGKC